MMQRAAPGHRVPERGRRQVYQIILPLLAAAAIGALLLNDYLASMIGFYETVIVFASAIISLLAILAYVPAFSLRAIEGILLVSVAGIFAAVLWYALYREGSGPLATPVLAVYPWLPVVSLLIFLALPGLRAPLYAFAGLVLVGLLTAPALLRTFEQGEAGDALFVLVQVYLANAVLIAAIYFFASFQRRFRSLEATANAMRRLANTDSLTGLGNRRQLERILSDELMRAERYQRPLSVIMTDIDDFKMLNDRYGHPAGDRVLVDLANRLSHSVRSADRVGRWGGEEFMIITPETRLEDAAQLAEVMRETVAAHPLAEQFPVTLSFGVASYRSGDRLDDLVARSDSALYLAKRSGKNLVRSEQQL